jgi:hypothetical protein
LKRASRIRARLRKVLADLGVGVSAGQLSDLLVAWAILLRSQPERSTIIAATTATFSAPSPASSTRRTSSSRTHARIFGWLRVVATREAFRLSNRECRHVRLEAMRPDGSWEAVVGDEFSLNDIVGARDALKILATLPHRQRADLALQVAGFS